MPRCKKIERVHGLFPGVVETLEAHGCKVEDVSSDVGTVRLPLRSLVLDWPEEEEEGVGLMRTPSGAYVFWCQQGEAYRCLHFVGMAPWADDDLLIEALQKAERARVRSRRIDPWLKELIRLRLMRLMIVAQTAEATSVIQLKERPPNHLLN